MAYVVTVANQKGGVGKTQTSANTAYALASMGQRVLAVDADPQSSLTLYTGCDPVYLDEQQFVLHDVLLDGRPAEEAILHLDDFDLLPASIRLARRARELVLDPVRGGQHVMRSALQPLQARYDFILIDTPPTLSDLFVNALVASDGVLIPIKTDRMSAYGFADLLDTIGDIRSSLNPTLEIVGVIPTMFQKGYTVDESVVAELGDLSRGRFRLFSPVRRSTNYDKAFDEAKPTLKAYPRTPGIEAYREVAEGLIRIAAEARR